MLNLVLTPRSRRRRLLLPCLICCLMPVSTSRVWGQSEPFAGIRLRGTLSDLAGNPTSATVNVVVRIYKTGTGGLPLYAETFDLAVAGGALEMTLGVGEGSTSDDLVAALAPDPMDTSYDRYLTMEIDSSGEEFMPRRRLSADAFAGYAMDSGSLGGLPASGYATMSQLAAELGNVARVDGPNTFSGSQTFSGGADFPSGSPITFQGAVNFAEQAGPPFTVSSNVQVDNLNAASAGSASSLSGHQWGTTPSRGCVVPQIGLAPSPMDCAPCDDDSGASTCGIQSGGYPADSWMLLARYTPPSTTGILEVTLGPGAVYCQEGVEVSLALEIRIQPAAVSLPPPAGWPDDPSNLLLVTPGQAVRETSTGDPGVWAFLDQGPFTARIHAASLTAGQAYHLFLKAVPLPPSPDLQPGVCYLTEAQVGLRYVPGVVTTSIVP